MTDAPSPAPDSLPAPAVGDLPPSAPDVVAMRRQQRRLAGLAQRPWLHEEVARRLASKLDPIRIEPADWIDWSAWLGGGDELVKQRYPQARRWVVEPTPELAERSRQLARASGGWLGRLLSARAPVLTEPVAQVPWPREGVQMLWANMTLHGASDLKGLMKSWHRHLAVGGFLMCSGLGPDTARELRSLYRDLGWPLPTIDFIDMHDLGDAMAKAGFSDPVMDMERLTLTWPDAQAMLAELHTWGGNVAHGRHAGLRTPRWKACLEAALNEHLRRPDGRLGLTLELVYGHAIKPEPRASVAPETRVSVDDMRRMVRQKPPGV